MGWLVGLFRAWLVGRLREEGYDEACLHALGIFGGLVSLIDWLFDTGSARARMLACQSHLEELTSTFGRFVRTHPSGLKRRLWY